MISKLLVKDPNQRIGVQDFDEILDHPFFDDFDFDNCYDVDAPLNPRQKRLTKQKENELMYLRPQAND